MSSVPKNTANQLASKPNNDMLKKYFVFHDPISKRCILCNKIYKHHNNTTNLKNHLKRKHKSVTVHLDSSKKVVSENDDVIDDPDSNSSSGTPQTVLSEATNMKNQIVTQKQVSIRKTFSKINEYKGNF